jgi:hypothetical protein
MFVIPEESDEFTYLFMNVVYVLLDEVLALWVLHYAAIECVQHVFGKGCDELEKLLERVIVVGVSKGVFLDLPVIDLHLLSELLPPSDEAGVGVIEL